MADPSWLSYFSISEDLEFRMGAGATEEILALSLAAPGILVCVQEPGRADVKARLRVGGATITEDDRIEWWPQDVTQLRGAWARAYPLAFHLLDRLSDLPLEELRSAVTDGRGDRWLLFDHRVRRWSQRDRLTALHPVGSDTLEAPLWARFEGSFEQIDALLLKLKQARSSQFSGV